jgi:hypothetical protein
MPLDLHNVAEQDDAATAWAFREADRAAGLRFDSEPEPVWEVKREAPEPEPQPEAPVSPDETEAAAMEPDYDPEAYSAHDDDAPGRPEPAANDAPKAEPADEPQPQPEPQSQPASDEPSPGDGASSRADAPRRERFVDTDEIKRAAEGHGAELLHALGVPWHNGGPTHILCPFHNDHDPSFRWDEAKGCAFCTCGITGADIFGLVGRRNGFDFTDAKIWVAEQLGRHDLIIEPVSSPGVTLAEIAEAKRLPIEFLRKMGWFNLARRGQNHDRSAVGIIYSDGNREWLRIRIALGGETKKKFRWKKGDREASLYRAHQVAEMRSAGYVFIVGGESCTVTMLFHNYPALGLPGEGCWNETRHAPLLDGFPKIYVVVEPDQGGQRVQEWVARSSIRSRVMFIFMTPAAKDMSALYLTDPAGFETTVHALMATAVPFDQEKHAPPKSEPAQEETRSRRSRDDAMAGGAVSPRGLPVIEYAGGRLADATDQAEKLLAAADPEIFQRSDFLVRLGMAEDMTAADGEKIKGPRLVTVGAMHLQDRMNRVIEFMKFDAKLDGFKPINPPRDVAEALRQRIGLWRYIPVIDGIASAPIFRADGSILDQPGFDPATHIYYAPTPGVVFCQIPPDPTKKQARDALNALCDLIGEFPFIQENGELAIGQPSPSRSVALSGLITPMVRRAILSAPIHGFDATDAGSGKSKLCSLPSIIARGHAAPVIPGGTALNPEEFEKKISTSLIGADAIVVVDNVEGRISSELLCSAATERMLYIRVLGFSKNILVPNGATPTSSATRPGTSYGSTTT